MSNVKVKTGKRKTSVTRAIVRMAVKYHSRSVGSSELRSSSKKTSKAS